MGRDECCKSVACEGCPVLVVLDKKRRYVTVLKHGSVLGSDLGVLKHDDVIGKPYGSWVELSSGVKAVILQPRLIDYIEKRFKRASQVIYPKDHGIIVMLLDLKPGMKVLEVGTGSGFTAIVLARIVGSEGHVYSYEVREDMARIALENIKAAGLESRVTVRIHDAREGVYEKGLEAAVVDIPDPWAVLPVLEEALIPGAPVVFFLPAVNQVYRLLGALEARQRWVETIVVEVLLREYEARADALRPRTTMVAHTGYIVSSRLALERG